MDLTLFFAVFSVLWKLTNGVKCYKCDAESKNSKTNSCQYFNENSEFMIECGNSTMCEKTQVTMLLPNGVTAVAVGRDCAKQQLPGEQRKINGKWEYINIIHEAYGEDCYLDTSEGRPTETIHCYCRGNLCNSSHLGGFSVTCLLVSALFCLRIIFRSFC